MLTKLDLSQAYQQILFAEESKELMVINTHRVLFRYIPSAVSSAAGGLWKFCSNGSQKWLSTWMIL